MVSFDESDLFDYESENDGSESRSSCMCYFILRLDNTVGHVSGLGYGVIVPTVVESKCDNFAFFVFVSIVADSKGGQLIKMFWRSSS